MKRIVLAVAVVSVLMPTEARPATSCVTEGPRVVVAYGTPPDREPASENPRSAARRYRREVSELFTRISGGYSIRWACGPPVRLDLSPVGDDGWYSRLDVENDQARAGLATEDVNLVLLYDSTTPWEDANGDGMSRLDIDSTPGLENPNNVGPSTSYVSRWSTRVILHELVHSFGALQPDAPNNDGRGHCNDGKDILCWWEPGPMSLDFGQDDYFDPDPEPGEYLATHFNLATDSVWIER